MVSMIIAIGKNGEIGADNKLLWHIPEELKHFKKLTEGKTLFMGRNTFDSIVKYNNGPLKNRISMVLTSKDLDENLDVMKVSSIDEAIDLSNGEIIIAGGARIYNEYFDRVEKIYLSKIDGEFEADAFFKEDLSEFKEIHQEDNDGWSFHILERCRA